MSDVTKIKTIPAWVFFDTLDLGSTSGPIEFTVEGIYTDITADQFGEEVLAKIVQGSNLRVTATFHEVTDELLKKIYGAGGLATPYQEAGSCSIEEHETQGACEAASGVWTPGKPEVIGFGSATVGQNIAALAKALKVVPLSVAEAGKQLYFWKAYPTPGGLKYSGTEKNEVQIEFTIIEDKTKPAAISKGILGDPSAYIE